MPTCTITNPITQHQHELSYTLLGDNSSPNKILFVMGLLTDGKAWQYQADYFSEKGYNVVFYDNRGIGRSTYPQNERCTTTRMAADAIALVDHLQWNNFHLVGVSMGGMISQEIALLAPHRLLSLTLIVTHFGGPTARAPLAGIYHIGNSLFYARTEDEQIKAAMKTLYSHSTYQPENRSRYNRLYEHHRKRIATRIKPTLGGMLGHFQAVLTHHVSYQELLKIRGAGYPILIMVGTEDLLVNTANSHILHQIIGGELYVVKNGAHGLLAEHYEEVNNVLYKHINAANQLTPDQRRQQRLHHILSLSNFACTHRSTCTHQVASVAVRGYLAGFVFRLLFHSYMNNQGTRSRLQQSRSFGLVIACIRILYVIANCSYNQYQFQLAVQSEPSTSKLPLPRTITVGKVITVAAALHVLRKNLQYIMH